MMANDNGTILLEGNMKNGKRDGIFRSYNEKGNLLNTMTYKNDSLLQKQ
jgi:antitoxin component YwqK of YwqJK toxin-antitoxin module